MTYFCLLSLNTVYGERTSRNLLTLKPDQLITLFVGPCWPQHDAHKISRLYDSLEWYTLEYTTPDYGITYS